MNYAKYQTIELTPSRKIQDSEIIPLHVAITPMSLLCANSYAQFPHLADIYHNGLYDGFDQDVLEQQIAITANTHKFYAMKPIHTMRQGFSLKHINYMSIVNVIVMIWFVVLLAGIFA